MGFPLAREPALASVVTIIGIPFVILLFLSRGRFGSSTWTQTARRIASPDL